MTIHFQPRRPGPLSSDESKQLTEFFMALMDLQPEENQNKGRLYENK